MGLELLHDRGRGPELIDTRITVYNLIGDFLNASKTEQAIADQYDLTAEQVAAARTYILINFDKVMARHREFDERDVRGNAPWINDLAAAAPDHLDLYRHWLRSRDYFDTGNGEFSPDERIAAFKEWLKNGVRAESVHDAI